MQYDIIKRRNPTTGPTATHTQQLKVKLYCWTWSLTRLQQITRASRRINKSFNAKWYSTWIDLKATLRGHNAVVHWLFGRIASEFAPLFLSPFHKRDWCRHARVRSAVEERFYVSSAGFLASLNRRPSWCLKQRSKGGSDFLFVLRWLRRVTSLRAILKIGFQNLSSYFGLRNDLHIQLPVCVSVRLFRVLDCWGGLYVFLVSFIHSSLVSGHFSAPPNVKRIILSSCFNFPFNWLLLLFVV